MTAPLQMCRRGNGNRSFGCYTLLMTSEGEGVGRACSGYPPWWVDQTAEAWCNVLLVDSTCD